MATLIDRERKLCFLHFPKTAGWWVANLLGKTGFKILDINFNGGHIGFSTLKEYGVAEDYQCFGFVRNPLDWYVSLYRFLLSRDWSPGKSKSQGDITKAIASDNINDFVEKCGNLGHYHFDYSMMYFYNLYSFEFEWTKPKNLELYEYENLYDNMLQISNKFDLNLMEFIKRDQDVLTNETVGKMIPSKSEVRDSISQQGINSIKKNSRMFLKFTNYEIEK